MNLLDLAVKIGVDDQASSKIEGIAGGIKDKVGSAFATVGKLAAGVGVAAGGAAVAIGTAATQSFASYEQLAGGVEKLYGSASDKLKQYAMNGAKTAGMSMNDYMQQATSFSAALINSLGGDVDKAADQTDKAMRLMSDNVNTFGTDAEAVQNAIQGLSRENYTMLDNLKLGYAGTKEGMQQLIDDANEYAKEQGINADLTMGNFSDMIDAIDLIQQKQNIWGTTSKEAMTTIEGSIGMVKASWENLLTAFGTGDQTQIDTAVGGIINGIFGQWDDEAGKRVGGIINNVAPVVQRVGGAILEQLPTIAERVAYTFLETLGGILGVDMTWLDGFFAEFDAMKERAAQAAQDFWAGFTENQSTDGFVSVFQTIQTAAGAFFDFITTHAGDIGSALGTAVDVLSQIGQGVSDFFAGFGQSFDGAGFGEALQGFMEGLQNVWTFVQDNILAHSEEIGAFVGQVATVIGDIAGKAGELFATLSPYIPFIATLLGTFGVLMPIISTVGTVIGAISGAVTFLTTVVGPALAMIQSIPGLIAVITTVLGGPITIIAAIVAAIVAFVATNEDARNAIMGAIQAVVDFFMALPATLSGIWETMKATFGEWVVAWRQSWEDFKTGAEEKWNSTVEWVRGIPERAKNALGDIGNTLKEAGLSLLGGLWDGMKQKADELFGWVGGIADTVASLKGPLPYDEKVLIANGTALMDGLDAGIVDTFQNRIAPYMSSMAGNIVGLLGDLAGTLHGAGHALIDGLFDGMVSAADNMLSWVSSLAGQIASLKGPLDYDRTVLIANGRALMSGLRGGLEVGFDRDVMPYVEDMAGSMQRALDTTGGMTVPVTYNAQPVNAQSQVTMTQDKAVLDMLQLILGRMPEGVYLDNGALVGQLAAPMNVALGRL